MATPTRPPAASTAFSLTGHSGANLTLIEEQGTTFVRKAATSAAQGARLKAQCEKLQAAREAGIPCPAVYRTGQDGDLYFFDMEFVSGETLAHAVISGKELRWPDLTARIADLLSRFRATGNGTIPAEAFVSKLGTILEQCRANPAVAGCLADVDRALTMMGGLAWDGIAASDCHGDMTLENMLLRQDGSLVFLDFDVPEHASWQLDLGKIHQDVLGHWCLRHMALENPGSVEMMNAQVALARARNALSPSLGRLMPDGTARLGQLACFHLARTLPYARTAPIAAFVAGRMKSVLRLR